MSKTVDLPPGVARVVVARGRVLVNVAEPVLDRGLAIGVGADRLRLEPAAPDAIPPAAMIDIRPALEQGVTAEMTKPVGRPAAEICETVVNHYPDWALANRHTVQCKMLRIDHPAEFTLRAPIRVPPHDAPLRLRAGLATHRGRGRLILRRAAPDGEMIETASIAFDPLKVGGQDLSTYQRVSHALAPRPEETELTLSVAFDAAETRDPNNPPYFFIADPHVGAADEDGDLAGALIVTPTAPPDASDGPFHWLCAPMPGFLDARSRLTLIDGDAAHPLMAGVSRRIDVLEDDGHSLVMTASDPDMYQFWIDGDAAFRQHLGPDPVTVRLPARHLTGAVRQLSVTDGAGAQRFYLGAHLTPRILTPPDILQTDGAAPFPGALFPQAGHRYDALRAQLAAGLDPEAQAQIAHCLSVVEGGHANVALKPLRFPEHEAPDVSIVIPAHNQVAATYLALASLLLAHNAASFEVIVIDDASTDETARLEQIVAGIKVIRNAQPQRFIRACNAGAAAARGRYVMLLNNDVEVTNGFLDALIDAFERFPNVGLAGSKLLYPDGRLQDAGGLVWKSGNPWNYGNGQNPWDPRFCYARQADYLTGAAMMTTKAIWDEVGGLSSYLEPMYFEDTDFAFKLRAAGYRTYFAPASVVYHFEGMTSGTDTSSGFKRHQEINRPKFKRRWAAAYAGFGEQGVNPDLEKDRGIVGRVLFIDYATPRPDRDAGSYAAIQEIKLVQSLGYKVTFLPRNLAHLGRYTEELEKMGVEVIYAPFHLTAEAYLEHHARDFTAFYITRFYVARDLLDRLRQLAPQTRILFNNADLHFLRELRAGLANDDPARIEAARLTRESELAVMTQVDVVLSYNEIEHAVIQSHTDGAVKIMKCPWVVETPPAPPPRAARTGLSFLGNYGHPPNVEAVRWFSEQVMPLLHPAHPDLALHLYGAAMPDDIRALASDRMRIEGFAPDAAAAYDRHSVFVAPLLSGAGIKGKVLAALAHGAPSVLSPIAAEGVGLRHGHDCLIAATELEWRDAIDALLTDAALWREISENARRYVERSFSFEAGRKLMRQAFEAVDLYSPEQ